MVERKGQEKREVRRCDVEGGEEDGAAQSNF